MLLLLAGCVEPGEVALLSGFDFGWQSFNHRLSALSVGVDDAGGVESAVVGGTSTTGVEPTYAEGCDPASCQEFPFTDRAALHATVTTLSAPGLRFARGSATLVVGSQGGSEPVTLEWEEAPGEVIPVIGGFSFDSRREVEDCYDPGFGWLPRHLALSVTREESGVVAHAAFSSGLSLEAERACLDHAAGDALVTVTVDVIALTGVESETREVQRSAAWDLGSSVAPVAQEPPASVLTAGGVGWAALDWTFHNNDGEGRGAYLRTLSFSAGDESSSSATNYSPGTQLSGFDYAFAGTVITVDPNDADRTVRDAGADYAPALDADGRAVATVLE